MSSAIRSCLPTISNPPITYGILSGVRRYQFPSGTLLEYADCLQTDAAINPGNSGGPLFDADGKLIGINGRGSFEKRGRVNVGVGYAISINQIKRFIGLLKSGRIVDHASLGATVSTDSDGRVIVDDILDGSDAYRRGLRYGDELLRFAGREIGTANAFKNALGTFPAGWRVPLTYRRDGKEFDLTCGSPACIARVNSKSSCKQRRNRKYRAVRAKTNHSPATNRSLNSRTSLRNLILATSRSPAVRVAAQRTRKRSHLCQMM